MSPFLYADFLLPDKSSRRLFHDNAAAMPIIDGHCHWFALLPLLPASRILPAHPLCADRRLDGSGQIPADFETFGSTVQDISFRNAKNYS